MKTRLFLFTLTLFFTASCSHEPHLTMHELGVDFQSDFENDHVKLVIGGGEVLNTNLTTNHLLGVCSNGGQLSMGSPAGTPTLTVTINHAISKSTTVTLDRDRYVGVMYDRLNHEITFQISDEPFGYD